MRFKGRALYNLIRLTHTEDPSSEAEPWQIAPYRQMSVAHLFSLLSNLGLSLTEDSFLSYGDSCETPEELTDSLTLEDVDDEQYEKVYLVVFELWRRLLPRKQTLSVFGDELDHLIFLYDSGELLDEEDLQNILSELEDILDETADKGADPKEALLMVAQYCAHDLETFLYDYITQQMDEGMQTYASELIDGFYDYVQARPWFDFLKARLFAESDAEEGSSLLLGMLEMQEEDPDLELAFEIARFVVNRGDTYLFIIAAHRLLALIEREEDLQALLHLIAEFYRCLDEENEEKVALSILTERKNYPEEHLVTAEDKKSIAMLLQDPERDKI
jgi:ElaB/YqjD/DUF883 family membrane-anchored ribosome-binding protein